MKAAKRCAHRSFPFLQWGLLECGEGTCLGYGSVSFSSCSQREASFLFLSLTCYYWVLGQFALVFISTVSVWQSLTAAPGDHNVEHLFKLGCS